MAGRARNRHRRGELLGLRWQYLDLDVPQVRVAAALTSAGGQLRLKRTKTRTIRTLHLDTDTAELLARQTTQSLGAVPTGVHPSRRQPTAAGGVSDRWRRQWPGLELPVIRVQSRP